MSQESEDPQHSERPACEDDPASRVLAFTGDGGDVLAFYQLEKSVVQFLCAVLDEDIRLVSTCGSILRPGDRGESAEQRALLSRIGSGPRVIRPVKRYNPCVM